MPTSLDYLKICLRLQCLQKTNTVSFTIWKFCHETPFAIWCFRKQNCTPVINYPFKGFVYFFTVQISYPLFPSNQLISPSLSTMLQECGCLLLSGFLYPLFSVNTSSAWRLPSLLNSLTIAEPSKCRNSGRKLADKSTDYNTGKKKQK